MKKIIVALITLFTLFLIGKPVFADNAYYQNAAYYQYNTPGYYDNYNDPQTYAYPDNSYTYNTPNPVYYIDNNDKNTLYSLARYNSYSQPTCPLKQAKRHYYHAKKIKRIKSCHSTCKVYKKATYKTKKVKHFKKRVKKPCRY